MVSSLPSVLKFFGLIALTDVISCACRTHVEVFFFKFGEGGRGTRITSSDFDDLR